MIIQTWQLVLILLVFIGSIFGLIVFLTQLKFKKAKNLAQEIGFSFFTRKHIPTEYVAVSKYLLYFWDFEFLSCGEISGQKVYFTQYLQKIASQLPYAYAIFSLFEKPYHFASDEERKTLQTQIDKIISGGLVTEVGIFYYHSIPWPLKKEEILKIAKELTVATQSLK